MDILRNYYRFRMKGGDTKNYFIGRNNYERRFLSTITKSIIKHVETGPAIWKQRRKEATAKIRFVQTKKETKLMSPGLQPPGRRGLTKWASDPYFVLPRPARIYW